jgi:hypothetical protein
MDLAAFKVQFRRFLQALDTCGVTPQEWTIRLRALRHALNKLQELGYNKQWYSTAAYATGDRDDDEATYLPAVLFKSIACIGLITNPKLQNYLLLILVQCWHKPAHVFRFLVFTITSSLTRLQ